MRSATSGGKRSDHGAQFLSSLKPQKKGDITPRLAKRGMHPAALNHHLGASPHTLHTGDLHNPPINLDNYPNLERGDREIIARPTNGEPHGVCSG
eukprot:superscaffoldBa00000179_g2455